MTRSLKTSDREYHLNLSDRQKTFLKKFAFFLLRAAGWIGLLSLLATVRDFLYEAQLLLYGPAEFVGRFNVIFSAELGRFHYTNPVGMMLRHFQLLVPIAAGVAAAAFLTVTGLRRLRQLQKAAKKDLFLCAALFYAAVGCGISASHFSIAEKCCEAFYRRAEQCRSIADHEKLCGKSVLNKVVGKGDRKFIDSLARFENSGFAPGRELQIFRNEKPAVYLLIWSGKGKILHRDWCHRSSTAPGAPF